MSTGCENYLDKWNTAWNIENNYENLKHLMFKNCIPEYIKAGINKTTYKLAVLADEYDETHRRSQTKPRYPHKLETQTPSRLRDMNYEKGRSNHPQSRNLQVTNNRPINRREIKPMVCHYCWKAEHSSANWWTRQNMKSKDSALNKPKEVVFSDKLQYKFKPFLPKGQIA